MKPNIGIEKSKQVEIQSLKIHQRSTNLYSDKVAEMYIGTLEYFNYLSRHEWED